MLQTTPPHPLLRLLLRVRLDLVGLTHSVSWCLGENDQDGGDLFTQDFAAPYRFDIHDERIEENAVQDKAEASPGKSPYEETLWHALFVDALLCGTRRCGTRTRVTCTNREAARCAPAPIIPF